MALSQEQLTRRNELVAKYRKNDKDTGSSPVQVVTLTFDIENLKEHLQEHGKDNHSRRGILLMVSKRRKLLDYTKRKDVETYKSLLQDLGLRK